MASLVEKTLDRLIDLVIDGGVGSKLPPQDQLSLQLKVSRTVLREALSKLEYLGVLTVKSKVGTTITAPDSWKVINQDVLAWRKRAAELS